MKDLKLFEPESKPAIKFTCRTCKHRERHECGAKIFQYCGVRKSNLTNNRLLKIKTTTLACFYYKPNK